MLVTYVVKNRGQGVRLGITAAKKLGSAVERNRCRRIIRAAFSSIYPDCGGKPENSINSEIFDRYDGMMRSFAENIRGLSENQFSPDYELMLYKCIMKACGREL
jgi:hypothetical protein